MANSPLVGRSASVTPFFAVRSLPRPPELLFEFLRGQDRFACELRYQDKWCVEAIFLLNAELFMCQRFDARPMAVQWAEAMRTAIEKGGVPERKE